MKASEFETLDKAVEAPPTASKPNQSLDEWKVTPPNAFVSSTSMKSRDQHSQRQQRACYTCGETNHLSRYCPKYRKDSSKQPEICRSYNRFPKSNYEEDGNKCSYGRQHKCQRCNKWGCKAIKHSDPRLRFLQDLKTKPQPQLHNHHLQLHLINHQHLLHYLDYLLLPFLHIQQSQKLSFVSVIFCGPLLHLQVNDCPCHWIVVVLYLL